MVGELSGDADSAPAEQQWREWELELVENGTADTELLNRLSNRLLDAGAVPAGHGSKLARVLGETSPTNGTQPATDFRDPLHRAVAEQVEQLLVWDRAVRTDAPDSVHQMRVTTRKIRSLLRDADGSSGSSGSTDTEWVQAELRELAAVLGVARDAEVLAERYQRQLDLLEPDLVRGRIRERLVKGAHRRYETGLRRSLIAMRSQRYFRLLDTLESWVAEVAAPPAGEEPAPVTIDTAYKKVRKAAKAAREAEAAEAAEEAEQAGAATEEAGEHSGDEALHRIRKRAKRLRYTASATGANKVADQAKLIQTLLGDHQDSVVSREHLIQQTEAAHVAGEDPLPTACCSSARPTWPKAATSSWTARCASSPRR